MIDLSRFSSMLPRIDNAPLLFIGAGSMGSNLIRAALSMGARNITVHDDDEVGPENIAVSWLQHVGLPKVESVQRQAQDYDARITAIHYRATAQTIKEFIQENPGAIIVESPDSMEARREVWRGVIAANDDNTVLVDYRIGGFNGQRYCVCLDSQDDVDLYSESMNSDGSGLACGEKAHPALTLGWGPMSFIMTLGMLGNGELPPLLYMANVSGKEIVWM